VRLYLAKPLGVAGLVSVVLFGLAAIVYPLLMSTVWQGQVYDPELGYDIEIFPHPSPPSGKHLLGTDPMGRDVLSRLVYSTRTSFVVGINAALVGSVLATAIGVSAAYYGGALDTVLMTLADAFILLPPAVVLLVLGLLFEMNAWQLGAIFGVFAGAGSLALLVKAQAQSVKGKQFVEAGRVAGGGGWRLIRTHILPNLLSMLSVNVMFIVTGSVLIEALMSFLHRTNLRTSWGMMIWLALEDNMSGFDLVDEWFVIVPPALAIMLFCGGFYLIGRTLDEVTNPRLRAR
jgi:peptide/nickel transport system permease protein